MGRSSQQQAAENRAKIVDTASHMFRESGVDNISVSDVMGALGMTVGGFYKHFESKDALVAEACNLAFDESVQAWRAVFKKAGRSSSDRSSALIRSYSRLRPADQRCPMLAFAPHMTLRSPGDDSLKAYNQGTHALLEEFLEGVAGQEAVSSDQSREAMVLFAAMIGARTIAQATGNLNWTRELEVAVVEAAKSGTFSADA